MAETRCIFCKGENHFIYSLNGYGINQCSNCLTCSLDKFPSSDEIKNYYQGFKFEMDVQHFKSILTPAVKNWFQSYRLPPNSKMLDIGGGAGFFAAAFEAFGLGKSTYIDLDASACKFAKETLQLNDVICSKIEEFKPPNEAKYDFIYCRHVIEHLVDPRVMVDAAIDLLNPGGTFILQFPNGLSLEYLAYPRRILPYAKKIQNSNHWNAAKTLSILASKQNAFAMDPIRHLWAITPQAILDYLEPHKCKLNASAKTKSISDPVYSPYSRNAHLLDSIRSSLAKHTLGRLRGGSHAVISITKKNQE